MPATRVMTPAVSRRKTQCRLVKYTPPSVPTTKRAVVPIDLVIASAGVGGGAPPATVEITYCCARHPPPITRRVSALIRDLSIAILAQINTRLVSIASASLEDFVWRGLHSAGAARELR